MSYTFLMCDCENCTSSLEQVEESSAVCFSDIPAYVLSRLNLTAERPYCSGNATESCPASRSGTTCEPSMASRGADSLTLSAEVSPARTSALPGKEPDLMGNTADYGSSLRESLARFCPATSSWRTPQLSLFEGGAELLQTLPRWGMWDDGELWELPTQERTIPGKEYGYLPTPSGTSNHGKNHVMGRLDEWGGSGNMWRGTEIGKMRCASFEEWMMGWPMGWSALTPLGMDKFQQWLDSHGEP